MMNEKPYITIIIPVYNDAKRLDLCLSALSSQSYSKKDFGVLVIDNWSDDDVEAVANKYNADLIREKRPGSYCARNYGIKHSKCDIIGFTDSDCIPSLNWIEIAAQHFLTNSKSFILSGKINVVSRGEKNNSLTLYDQQYHFNQKKFSKKKNFAATANLFCRRDVFANVGLFNEKYFSYGDVEFGERVVAKGYNIDFNNRLVVSHPQINSLKALWNRSRRLAGGGRQYRVDKGYSRPFEMLYILLLIIGTPLIIINRFFYNDISSFRSRFSFACLSLVVHISKCLELTRLLIADKPPERK